MSSFTIRDNNGCLVLRCIGQTENVLKAYDYFIQKYGYDNGKQTFTSYYFQVYAGYVPSTM